ncbi:MAG TPA: hypothetical protein VIK52_03645 [Opitutaceae bacterium]
MNTEGRACDRITAIRDRAALDLADGRPFSRRTLIRRALVTPFILLLAVASGCKTPPKTPDHDSMSARFFMEARAGEQGLPIKLQVSGVTLDVDPRAILVEFDIARVQLVDGEFGPGLMFVLTPQAARDLYRISATSQGRRLVLSLNGTPVSATPFTGPLGSGAIIVYPELDPSKMGKLARDLDLTSIDVQARAAKQK